MQAFTPFVQVTTYATRHFATLGLAPAAANHFFSPFHLGLHTLCRFAIIILSRLVGWIALATPILNTEFSGIPAGVAASSLCSYWHLLFA